MMGKIVFKSILQIVNNTVFKTILKILFYKILFKSILKTDNKIVFENSFSKYFEKSTVQHVVLLQQHLGV